ncbi:hypothetical protein [Ruania halotolerans]|nr:hypothetical protein [Ruania halotolerans]UFU07913.1 hypothetical protein LQF10_07395 [Ruania halotolerans]
MTEHSSREHLPGLHGHPTHTELVSKDPEATRAFGAQVFGRHSCGRTACG